MARSHRRARRRARRARRASPATGRCARRRHGPPPPTRPRGSSWTRGWRHDRPHRSGGRNSRPRSPHDQRGEFTARLLGTQRAARPCVRPRMPVGRWPPIQAGGPASREARAPTSPGRLPGDEATTRIVDPARQPPTGRRRRAPPSRRSRTRRARSRSSRTPSAPPRPGRAGGPASAPARASAGSTTLT